MVCFQRVKGPSCGGLLTSFCVASDGSTRKSIGSRVHVNIGMILKTLKKEMQMACYLNI